MVKKNSGGPATNSATCVATRQITSGGMSLRDYFAGQALAGLTANLQEGPGVRLNDLARYAYEIANVMIAESEK